MALYSQEVIRPLSVPTRLSINAPATQMLMTAPKNSRLLPIWLLISTVGCFSGCVVSSHPLSGEDTSTLDRQLIGSWEPIEEKPSKQPGPYVVERKADSKTTLTVKSPDLKDGPLEVMATELGERKYLSVRGSDPKHHDEWAIFQYEWLNEDSFRLRPMDTEFVANQIKAKRVAGRIIEQEKKGPDDAGKNQVTFNNVRLEEPTDKLRKYVQESGDKLFAKDWLTFRRLKTK